MGREQCQKPAGLGSTPLLLTSGQLLTSQVLRSLVWEAGMVAVPGSEDCHEDEMNSRRKCAGQDVEPSKHSVRVGQCRGYEPRDEGREVGK